MSSNTQESVPDTAQKSVTDWLMQVISRKEPTELHGHEPGQNGNGVAPNGNGNHIGQNGNGAVHEETRVNPLFVKTENGKGNIAIAEPVRMPAAEISADDLCGPPAFGPVPRVLRDEITADDLCFVPKPIESRNGSATEMPPAAADFNPDYYPQVAQIAPDSTMMAAAQPAPEPIFVAQPQAIPEPFAAPQPEPAISVEVPAQPVQAEVSDPFLHAQAPITAHVTATPEVPDVFGIAPAPIAQPAAAAEVHPAVSGADVFAAAQQPFSPEPVASSQVHDDVFGFGPAPVPQPAVAAAPDPFAVQPISAVAPPVAEIQPPAPEPERVVFAAPQVVSETPVAMDFVAAAPVVEQSVAAEAALNEEPQIVPPFDIPVETSASVHVTPIQAAPEIQSPEPVHVAPEIQTPLHIPEPVQAQAAPEIQTPLHVPEPVQAQAAPEIQATPQPPVAEASAGLAKIPREAPAKRTKRGKRDRAVTVADICRDWVLEEMMDRDPGGLAAGSASEEELEDSPEGEGEEAAESVFAREGIWGEGERKEITDGASESALALTDDGTEIEGDARSSAVRTLLHMGSMLPWLARESPASDARNKQNIALTQEVRQEVAGMRLVQHEIRSTVHDHSMQLKRVEEQLTRVRETLVDEADGTADLVTSVKSTTRTVQVVGIGVCALLGFVLVMVMLLFLRR